MQRPGQPKEARAHATAHDSTTARSAARIHAQIALMRHAAPQVAACYDFLASEADSSYMTGQVLHPNGGTITCGG